MMKKNTFGNISISAITFGSMALTDLYNPNPDLMEGNQALETALDAGIDTIHTAHHYGEGSAFRILRKILAKRASRQDIKIAAKIEGHPLRIKSAKEGIDPTRHALDRDFIDFAQLVESDPDYTTRVNPDDIIRDLHIQGPTFEAISRLKSDGLIRKIGVEVYNPEQLRKGVDCPALDFVVLDQSIIRQTAFEKDVLELISKNDMGVFAIRPLAGGWLTNTYRCLGDFSPGDKRTQWYWPGESYRKPVAQFCEKNSLDITETAIRFLLGQTVISSIVIGMRTVKHVNQALAALDKGPLPGALQEELESLFQQPIILEPE